MKKFVGVMLMMALVMAPAAAFADPGFEGTVEYEVYDASDAANTLNQIPGWGYIGIDATLTPDPDPSTPPTIDADPANINVTVPIQFLWAAFESAGGVVESPAYYIRNNSDSAELNVTMSSFTQLSGPAVTGLRLDLVGTEMALSDILNAADHTYATVLAPETQWDFEFGGQYTGGFTEAALGDSEIQMQYSLVLTFDVDID